MGVVIRLLVFIVGALGLILTGLVGAHDYFGVDTQALLMRMGETPGGVATSAQGAFASGLDWLGGMIADTMGASDPENPGAVATYGPTGIAAIVSALLLLFSTRR
ncbi:MAG: hypothetical protein Kow00133_03490 [Amphiplicatus sp.]